MKEQIVVSIKAEVEGQSIEVSSESKVKLEKCLKEHSNDNKEFVLEGN